MILSPHASFHLSLKQVSTTAVAISLYRYVGAKGAATGNEAGGNWETQMRLIDSSSVGCLKIFRNHRSYMLNHTYWHSGYRGVEKFVGSRTKGRTKRSK